MADVLGFFLLDESGEPSRDLYVDMLYSFYLPVDAPRMITSREEFPILSEAWGFKITSLKPIQVKGLQEELSLLRRRMVAYLPAAEKEFNDAIALCDLAIQREVGVMVAGP